MILMIFDGNFFFYVKYFLIFGGFEFNIKKF